MCDCHKGHNIMLGGTEVDYSPNPGLGAALQFPDSGDYVQWENPTAPMPDTIDWGFGTPSPNAGGFNWGGLVNPIVQAGTRVFESIYTPKPVYQTANDGHGASQTTLWSSLPGGITTLPGGLSTPGLGTLALVGIGLFVAMKVFSGGSKH